MCADEKLRALTSSRASGSVQNSKPFVLRGDEETSVPVYTLSPELLIETWSRDAETIYGYEAQEIVGEPVAVICPGDEERKNFEDFARDIADKGRALVYEACRVRKDGAVIDVAFCLAPLHGRDGEVKGFAAIARDIIERDVHRQARQVLLNELNHRVKNTLAMVQSIARLTLRQTKSPEEFARNLNGRILALAGAHDVLTAASWLGADVALLVRNPMILAGSRSKSMIHSGPRVTLDPQMAVGFSVVLHELGTNAKKYGALSVQDGRVHLSWEVTDGGDVLKFRWLERGGPTVREPEKRGFGMVIIEESLRGLSGEANLRFEPDGVVCDMNLPIGTAKGSHREKP